MSGHDELCAGHELADLEDEDGIDGPWEKAMAQAMRDDATAALVTAGRKLRQLRAEWSTTLRHTPELTRRLIMAWAAFDRALDTFDRGRGES